MHIIIGILTAVAGLFWAITALQNSGAIDSLNPFLWRRRAQWRKKIAKKPIYALSAPVDVAGLLIVAIAKIEGELTQEQKQKILTVFQSEFHLDENQARDLFKSSAFLLRDEDITPQDIDSIFERSKLNFTQGKVKSILLIMQQISEVDGNLSVEQKNIIEAIEACFQKTNDTW